MVSYSVKININSETREMLQKGYSLYLFKGVDAGPGAVSTIWDKITGKELYEQEPIDISWEEEYYIGETSASTHTSGSVVTGSNPYVDAKNVKTVSFKNKYVYQGTSWDPNPTSEEIENGFIIQNEPPHTTNFYVSQKVSSSKNKSDFILVQELFGHGGSGTFKPIEVIAMIMANHEETKGAIITQAFSKGIVVTFTTTQSIELSFDKDKGWEGPTGSCHEFPEKTLIYNFLNEKHRMMKRKMESQLKSQNGTLPVEKRHDWGANLYERLILEWPDKKNPGSGQVSLKNPSDGTVRKCDVPSDQNLDRKADGTITNNTNTTIQYKLSP